MNNRRFDVVLAAEAAREYAALDHSVVDIVNKAIDELEIRADDIGKPLGNKSGSKLAGCREIKLRDAGIRIVYRTTSQVVHVLSVVYILAIERRSRDMVFKLAANRYRGLNEDAQAAVKKGKDWTEKKRGK